MAGFVRKAKSSDGGGFELAPAGNHTAVCVAFVDLGTHTEQYGQQPSADVEKVFICWELADVVTRPVVGRDFRASLHTKSNLRQWLKSWRAGKDLADDENFDLTVLVGKKCIVTVEHKKSGDRTFASVINVSAPIKGLAIPEPEHTPYCWTRMDGTPFHPPEWLPYLYGRPIEDWVATCIEARKARLTGDGPDPDYDADDLGPSADDDTEIPF